MRVVAFAKATLTLRVLRRRPDDGYHELEALTTSLSDPHDVLDIAPAGAMEMTVVGGDSVPADASNLAWQAAVLAGATVSLRVQKTIPAEAGLGGGSSDAAAVLRALDAPVELAAQLGADVPYCVAGGLAWMRGVGDVIAPIDDAPTDYRVLVAVPPFGLSTPRVYAMWDELGAPTARRRVDPPRSLRALTDALFNDLEPAAEAVEPGLAPWRDAAEVVVGQPGVMAGSGSAVLFVTDATAPWADDTPERLRAELPGTRAWLATPVGRGLGAEGC